MATSKALSLILFGVLLIAGINASKQFGGVNYYNTNYADQAAAASQTGNTIAYNSVLGGYPYSVGLAGYGYPYSLGGLGGVNYYSNNYDNQAAEASSTGSTTAYNSALGLGLGGLNYYNTNYANQAAFASQTGNTVAYNSVLGGYPYSVGLAGYGYPYSLGGLSGLNYYSNNYANQAAYASQTGSTTAYNTVYGYPYGGFGYY